MSVELRSPVAPLGYANHLGYSDVNPYEIVGKVGQYGFRVRAMKAEPLHNHSDMDFHPGGFVGHYADQGKQRWALSSDPEGVEKIIRLCRGKPGSGRRRPGFYYSKHGERFDVSDQPSKFYDFNF